MKRYNPKDIEPKWQKTWAETKIYQASEDPTKPKQYVLEFFPYPSGVAMHVGHVRNYSIGDVIARHARMTGHNVLHPMGWDAFGLPAENFAIKHNISPQVAVADNTKKFKQQLTQMGFGYDWSREINSTDPQYYKWTQWFFTLLFKRGLAYRKESLVNWDPVDKTVLANEQVIDGYAERSGAKVEKIPLAQWFFKITDYADRLVEDLEDLNWSESIKSMQRNWIGRSAGAKVDFGIDGSSEVITVFTTRPDTLFGVTFMVLAPEHPLVKNITTPGQKPEVEAYIQAAQGKTEIERQDDSRAKTGIFTGAYAINPVNGERVPVWIADYVLAGYGTGAVMAVPAHDERDFEFAQKYQLPIKPVIIREHVDPLRPPRKDEPTMQREVAQIIVQHPTEDTYLLLTLKGWETETYSLPIGGVEPGETPEKAACRELLEETGYNDVGDFVQAVDPYIANFYHEFKKTNVRGRFYTFTTRLKSLQQDIISSEEQAKHSISWVSLDELQQKLHGQGSERVIEAVRNGSQALIGEGTMINSGKYNDISSAEAREEIVQDLEKQKVAEEKINYKIRDWLISRQRYWGAPIPVVWVEESLVADVKSAFITEAKEQNQTKEQDGATYLALALPEAQLPVVLPEVESYKPDDSGRGPLARQEDWVHVWINTETGETVAHSQPRPARGEWVEGWRETDTMDGFACSSWYFLRFADPHNNEVPFARDKADFWLPVDTYIGGAEHAVMHLLYARFWTKVMYDAGLIDFTEPFKTLRNQGMIQGPDGQKMSKSKGNVIAPDDIIEQGYGADAIRIMELFIGPWNQSANWSVEGMGGCFRFLQRVWTLAQEYLEAQPAADGEDVALLKATHKAIKKVSEDLHELGFNTAIAALMEFTNELYKIKAAEGFKAGTSWQFTFSSLLQLLAPFAPHITEELWHELGHKDSIHLSQWPEWNEQYLVQDTVTVVVQVNGKVRAQLQVPSEASEEEIVAAAKADAKVASYLADQTIRKTIYVPGKLVSFVVG